MRERQFIEQNKEKWKAFETLLNSKESNPEKLGKLFVEITDDLSYARTFYPNRSVRVYLNHLAQQVFNKLYKARKRKKNKIAHFFLEAIPSSVFHARKELFLSFVIFVVAMAAGVFSAIQDPEFTKSILSDSYVRMTEENIANNDAMAVYKGDNQFSMFVRIAANNLIIDFRTFLSGLLFGIWAIVMLVYNGIMVGAFQYFFVERGLFSESFLTIWMHGALEMSAAVIAGGAGLILGRGVVFPGTYSRLQSLMLAAKQGLKILLIAVFMTTFAAFVESFVTRYTGMHNAVRLLWIALSFAFVIGYFIVLPYIKWKKNTLLPQPVERLNEELNFSIERNSIKSIGRLFSDGFGIYRKTLAKYLPIISVVSIFYTVAIVLFCYENISATFQFYTQSFVYGPLAPIVWTYNNLGVIFSIERIDLKLFLNVSLLLIAFVFAFYSFNGILNQHNQALSKPKFVYNRTILLVSFVATALVLSFNFLPVGWVWLLIITPMPILLLYFAAILYSENHKLNTRIAFTTFWKSYFLYYAFVLICTLIFTLFTSAIFAIFFTFSNMLFDLSSINAYKIFIAVYVFFCSFGLLFVIPPVVYGFCMAYFSNREIILAEGLNEKLQSLNITTPNE